MKPTNNKSLSIGLVHIGKREKSGLQILEKLKQYELSVSQWDVLQENNKLDGIDKVNVIVVNIGTVNFEYDELLSQLFDTDIKIIINEAVLTNKLSGIKRQSWERHLLNKIDSSFSIMPSRDESHSDKEKPINFNEFGINKIWILAASIGGPEAIGQFLEEFVPSDKCFFIIIQHIDKEFLPIMAQQFNHNSTLKVELPLSGMEIMQSNCIIYPSDENITFFKNGKIELNAMDKIYPFSPCIDAAVEKLLNNISHLNIAVFSGMSTDGIHAANKVKLKSGKVITQTEDSCVLSSIVAGVKKIIDIDFEGTPKEMAQFIKNS